MKKFHFLIGAIFAAFLISACDGEDSRKALRNTGSPFGKVGGNFPDQKDETSKKKTQSVKERAEEGKRAVRENTGSPFGKVGGSHRDQKVDHKDDTNKAKPNGQPFGSLE